MAEQVRFDILVDDLGSKVLKDFSRNVKRHVNSAMQTMWKLDGLLGKTERKTRSLGAAFRSLDTAGAGRLTNRLKTAEGQLDRMISKAGKLQHLLGGASAGGPGAGISRGGRGRGLGMMGLGALSGYLAPAAAVAGLTQMIQTGAELESQLVDIRAILSTTDGFSGKGFDNLMANMRQLGADTIFTTRDVYGATKYMAMAGLNIDQINKSMKSVTSIAAISGMNLDRSADIVTNIQTAYGIAADNMGNVADVLARTITSSNVNMEELGEAFKYAGNEAARNGIDFKEMAAAIGVLGNNGIKASMAGTNLRQMMMRMKAPTAQAQKVLDKYNYSFKEVVDGKTRLKSFSTIVKDVSRLGMDAEELKDLFGVYGGTAFGALSTSKDEKGNLMLDVLTGKNSNAAGIADKMADQKMKTFSGTVARLKAQFELLSDNLFQRVSPAITQVMNLLIDGLKWLNQEGNPILSGITTAFNVAAEVLTWLYNTVKNNAKVLGWLTGAALGAYGAFKAWSILTTLTTWLIGFGKTAWAVMKAMVSLKKAQELLNLAMMKNPVGLVVAGIMVLGGVLVWAWNKFETFRAVVFTVWEFLKDFGESVAEIFRNAFESIGKAIDAFKKGQWSKGIDILFNTAASKKTNKPSAWERGKARAASGEGTFKLKDILSKFSLPNIADIGNMFGTTGDTSSNIDVDLGGTGAGGGSGSGSGSGDASVKSFRGEKSTTGGLVINVQTLFSVQTDTLLRSLGDDGMAIRDELVRQFTAIVKDVELSHGA